MSHLHEKELSRFPPKSVTWVRILENGDFQAEYYDYSCDEESPFAHDFSIFNLVKQQAIHQMKLLLSGKSDIEDEQLLDLVCAKFDKRSEIEDWCKTNEVACEHFYERT